jgi:hypothetical protein
MVRDGWRASSAVGVLLAALLLAGCASTSPTIQPAGPAPAPAQPTLQELMQQAQSAQTSGQRERARQAWRNAAKAYPTQKSPWQGLAQDYFDAADYGNAILAAQEVLQRDAEDTLAHSVLAVSGLRLSTVSLVALRDRGSYSVGSRDEALGLTRAMREALGETPPAPVRAEVPARSASPAPVAAAKAAAAPARLAAPAATPVATPAVNTVPAGAARSTGRAGAGGVVPVAATPVTTSGATPAPRPAVPSPAPKATTAAPAANPKPASADPFKLLN